MRKTIGNIAPMPTVAGSVHIMTVRNMKKRTVPTCSGRSLTLETSAAKAQGIETDAGAGRQVAHRGGIDQGYVRLGDIGHRLARRVDDAQAPAHRFAQQGLKRCEQEEVVLGRIVEAHRPAVLAVDLDPETVSGCVVAAAHAGQLGSQGDQAPDTLRGRIP